MIADYFTKPLQGILFYKFRDQILGVVPMDTIVGDHRSVLDHNTTKAPRKAYGAKVARQSPSTTGIGRPSKAVIRVTPKSRKRVRDKTCGPINTNSMWQGLPRFRSDQGAKFCGVKNNVLE
jgi:hypothetical protein